MGYDWKRAADYHYEQQQAQKDLKHNPISKEAQGKAMQLFNETLEQNRRIELQQHRRHFHCHIKGCSVVSSGPNGSPLIPTGLLRCDSCGLWTCELNHYHHNHCQKCWEHFNKTGRFPRRIKPQQWITIGWVSLGIVALPFIFIFALYILLPLIIALGIIVLLFFGLVSSGEGGKKEWPWER